MSLRMWMIVFVLIASRLAPPLWAGQHTDPANDFYYRSLAACLQTRAEQQGRSSAEEESENVIVVERPDITRGFPELAGHFRIEYLDNAALRQRFRRLRRAFPVIELAPMKNWGDVLVAGCEVYSLRVRRGKIILGVAGGYYVHWKYDCQTGKYVIGSVDRWVLRVD